MADIGFDDTPGINDPAIGMTVSAAPCLLVTLALPLPSLITLAAADISPPAPLW